MWRFSIAAVLLLALTVLLIDTLFGDYGYFRDAKTVPQQTAWYNQLEQSPDVVTRPADEEQRLDPAQPNLLPASPGGGAASGSNVNVRRGGHSPNKTEVVLLDSLDMARLPNAADGAEERDWPAFQTDKGTNAASPSSAPGELGVNDPADGIEADEKALLAPTRPRERPRAHTQPQTSRQIADAQRRLASLGYNPGPADGRMGTRTEASVRAFQKDARLRIDGRIDNRLIARLDAEARTRSQQREQKAMARTPPRKSEKPSPQRGFFGSVLGGLQRLTGREFDSVRHPDELTRYCRNNPETWIYDFGREAFVYCGNVIAGGAASPRPPTASAETAATR